MLQSKKVVSVTVRQEGDDGSYSARTFVFMNL